MMIRRHGDWLAANVGEGLVMMSGEKGSYIRLSKVGTRVWGLIETPRTVEEVCGQLTAEFYVSPEVCRADVEDFLKELAKHGAIALDPAPAA